MTLLTRLIFALHALSAIPILIDPVYFGNYFMERPKLLSYALTATGKPQQEMLYAYERVAVAFQVFVGLSGLFVGVENWYMSFALMAYDLANCWALNEFLQRKPSHAEKYHTVMIAFGVSAAIGFVGLLRRWAKNGIRFQVNEKVKNWFTIAQLAAAPLTFWIQVAMAFPFDLSIYDIGSSKFQNVLLNDGKLFLDLQCHRIQAGLAALFILTLGSLIAKDTNIFAPHCVTHIAMGASFMALLSTRHGASMGNFYFPAFLHFLCGLANGLNYAKSYRQQVHDLLMSMVTKLEVKDGEKSKTE